MSLPKGEPFFRLQLYERLWISRVEVYERVGKNLSMFRYLKGLFCLKNTNRTSLWQNVHSITFIINRNGTQLDKVVHTPVGQEGMVL